MVGPQPRLQQPGQAHARIRTPGHPHHRRQPGPPGQLLGSLGAITAHRHRPLPAATTDRVSAQRDANLPYSWPPLTQRPRTTRTIHPHGRHHRRQQAIPTTM